MALRSALVIAIVVVSMTTVFAQARTPSVHSKVPPNRDEPWVAPLHEEGVQARSLADLATDSDLVVDAVLTRIRGVLSDDEVEIWTEYHIRPNRIFFTRLMEGSSKPGPAALNMLVVRGGEMTLNGTLAKVINPKMLPIKSGARFLIFLKRSKPHQFTLTSGSAGIFEIIDASRVEPLLHPAFRHSEPEVKGLTLNEISQRVLAAGPAR